MINASLHINLLSWFVRPNTEHSVGGHVATVTKATPLAVADRQITA